MKLQLEFLSDVCFGMGLGLGFCVPHLIPQPVCAQKLSLLGVYVPLFFGVCAFAVFAAFVSHTPMSVKFGFLHAFGGSFFR